MPPYVRPPDTTGLLHFRIATEVDVIRLQTRVRHEAERHGFERRVCWELAVVASELATNLIKYAGSGLIRLGFCPHGAEAGRPPGRPFLQIEALDEGPGFEDPQVALRDGISEGRVRAEAPNPTSLRGLGCGLGAVARLSDEMELGNRPGGGAFVRARRYLLPPPR